MTPARNVVTCRLREHRDRLGLTQTQVADELVNLAWKLTQREVGINANMVSKWERGTKRPTKEYRLLLCVLYNASEEELGLRCPLPVPDPGIVAKLQSLSPTRQGSLTPGMPATCDMTFTSTCTDVIVSLDGRLFYMKRRDLLRHGAVLAGMGLLQSMNGVALYPDHSRPAVVPEEVIDKGYVESLQWMTDGYRGLYDRVPAPVILAGLSLHLAALDPLLNGNHAAGVRCSLFRAYGDLAHLAGRTAFYLQDMKRARRYYSQALQASREAGDPALHTYSLVYIGFALIHQGKAQDAADLLVAGHGIAQEAGPRAKALIADVEAQAHASAQSSRACHQALFRADRAMDRATEHPDPRWANVEIDLARHVGARGICRMRLGDGKRAEEDLAATIRTVDDSLVKRKCTYYLELAGAGITQDKVEDACIALSQALSIAERAQSPHLLNRVFVTRRELDKWQGSTPLHLLDEKLALVRRDVRRLGEPT